MDRYFFFRKLMDVLTEQGFAITGAKLSDYQLVIDGECGGDSVRMVVDAWKTTDWEPKVTE